MTAGAVPRSWPRRAALVTAGLAGAIAFAWPLFLAPTTRLDPLLAPVGFALVLPLVLAVVLTELTGNTLDAKGLAMLGVLCAVGAALRPLSAGTAGVDLIFFLLLLGGRVFGPGFGFALGNLTLFASALLTGGVGPWLPYQMLAAGFVAASAACWPRLRGRAEVWLLGVLGFVTAFAYGWLMDFAFWPFGIGPATQFSYDPAAGPWTNLHTFVLYNLATSMGWNLGRAITNVVLLAVLGPALLRVLRRAARRGIVPREVSSGRTAGNTVGVGRG